MIEPMNVCTNPRLLPTLTKLAVDSAARVVAQGLAKVCRCQWVGSFQVAFRGATLIPYSAILSWRMSFFSTTRFALHWMANKAPLKHFERIATYRCRYFELMTACFLGQMVKSVCILYWYIDVFFCRVLAAETWNMITQ
jgi:hypothetical protein